MAAKTIPSGGLSAATNPSARLQELLRGDSNVLDKNTEKNTEELTEEDKEIIAEINAENNTHSQTETITGLRSQSITESYTETQPSTRTQRRKPVKTEVSVSSNVSVRQRIVEDLQKEPVVRKTIDIPASLNERLQDYCAAKRIKTERRVFLVLLENFLEEEGF